MQISVSNLQELLEGIQNINEQTTINITEDFTIDSVVNINTDQVVYIDLGGNTLTANVDNAFTISGGVIWIANGSIKSTANLLITIDGSASVVLHENLTINGTGKIASVGKKGHLFFNGATAICTLTENPAISVEGYTRATANSTFTMRSGCLISENSTAIEVSKRGIVEILGGKIHADGIAIQKIDDTNTVVTISGATIVGSVPDGTYFEPVDTDDMDIKDQTDTIQDDSSETSTSGTDITDIESTEDPIVETTSQFPENDTDSIEDTFESPIDVEVQTDIAETITASEPEEPANDVEIMQTTEPEQIVVKMFATEQHIAPVKSAALKTSTIVYSIPNAKYPIGNIIGSIRIFNEEHIDPVTNTKFVRIEYKLPGIGRRAIGYIFASAIPVNV